VSKTIVGDHLVENPDYYSKIGVQMILDTLKSEMNQANYQGLEAVDKAFTNLVLFHMVLERANLTGDRTTPMVLDAEMRKSILKHLEKNCWSDLTDQYFGSRPPPLEKAREEFEKGTETVLTLVEKPGITIEMTPALGMAFTRMYRASPVDPEKHQAEVAKAGIEKLSRPPGRW